MEKKITKREMLSLLRVAQRFQAQDCGNSSIDITLKRDDKNCKLWFVVSAIVNGKVYSVFCYNFRSFEDNKAELQRFMDTIKIWQ